VLSLACIVLGSSATPARALTKKQVFGIGNIKDPRAFDDPRLKALRPKSTRMIVDYNVARTPGFERDRIDAWYNGALDARLTPLLTFQGANSEAPSLAKYSNAFGAALLRWPRIREWQAWNEANHIGEPATFAHPERAAAYGKAMERRCPRCTVLPLTYALSDSRRSKRWLRRFLVAYGRTPKIWAVHAYTDANRFGFGLLERFLSAHPRGRVWITETGGLAKYIGPYDYDLARQKKATRFAFEAALRFRSRVDRMYYWEWYGQPDPRAARWDSGLVTFDGKPRPAYRKALRNRFKRR